MRFPHFSLTGAPERMTLSVFRLFSHYNVINQIFVRIFSKKIQLYFM